MKDETTGWLAEAAARLELERPAFAAEGEIPGPGPQEVQPIALVRAVPAAARSSSPARTSFPVRPRASGRRSVPAARPYRRTEARRPVHVGVMLLRPGGPYPDFAVGADLSPVGARLLSDELLLPFDRVEVAFRLPWSSDDYRFACEVVRILPAPPDEYGARYTVGLRFLDVTAEEAERLRRALRGIPPVLPLARRAS